jgi:hypothetical protein
MRNSYVTLVGKPKGKRPFGRPSCGGVGDIKIDLKEIGCESTDWIYLLQ